jgi:hypothetical protein
VTGTLQVGVAHLHADQNESSQSQQRRQRSYEFQNFRAHSPNSVPVRDLLSKCTATKRRNAAQVLRGALACAADGS